METIAERSIEHHLLGLIEEWKADLFDLNFKDIDGWNDGNRVVASAQYAYIKFGLILEKIRNECAYKYCADKLKTVSVPGVKKIGGLKRTRSSTVKGWNSRALR